ncbi:TonB-dependent receptor [Spirosoma rhododendri]|uniref:TonB-dependent receptor n=1 Tax=Spirosoma rhododendri TaxID=2728024 RepID=A0A7L5DSG8_9BACT|nr:TonB-dependent receptor [Spirosoma rhododendri]QJD79508.1 TonB-dependent receptor [Spirosoma rhododendri]
MTDSYRLYRLLTGVFIGLFTLSAAWGQSVRGHITDATTGADLPGVAILVQGTTTGAITDASGQYVLTTEPGSYTLQISFVGYTTQRQPVQVTAGSATTLDVRLIESLASLNEVVVIGSRSTQARSSTQTVAPVDVIQSRDLLATGRIDITQQLNFVAPSFNSSRQTVSDGTDHVDPATLRGLGPDQVLVLLNGKRQHNQALINLNGTIGRGSVGTDLNAIPSTAIERVEVLRDGASSQYGSDAIAGVINLRLKEQPGTTVNAQLGQQYKGDGQIAQIGINHGFKLGQKGVLSLTGELRHRGATNRAGDYTGPVYVNWNVGQQTGETAASYVARRQQLYQQDQALIQQNNFDRRNNLQVGQARVENAGFFLNARMPITGTNASVYATGGLNYRRGLAGGFYRYPYQTTQVISALYPNGFLPNIQSTINDQSLLVGVNGENNGWRWDISNVYGGNSFRFDVINSNNASLAYLGATNNPTSFYAGTLSFYQNTADASAAKDFGKQLGLTSFNVAGGLTYRNDQYRIKPGEAASYLNFSPQTGQTGGAQVFPGYQPANAVNATRHVYGAYVDLESDITQRLLVDVAGRYEYYTDFGGNLAGKLAARYRFSEAFSLRGSVSNGFRAPSLHQRYFSAISTVFVSTGTGLEPRQTGTFRNDSPIAQAFGVPSLGAERSTNFSIGITSRPLSNVSLTVDAYQINIQNRIIYSNQFSRGTTGAGLIVATILNNAGQTDVNSAQFFTNAVNTQTRGLDVVIATNPRLSTGTLDITLAANVNQTKLVGDIQRPANIPADATFGNFLFNRQDSARLTLAQPRSKIQLTFNYRLRKFGAVLRLSRFGTVASYDPANPALDETQSPRIVTDLSGSYRVLKNVTITIGANNLLDVYPDPLRVTNYPTPERYGSAALDNSSFGRFVYGRAATQFGFNGGYYFANLSAAF